MEYGAWPANRNGNFAYLRRGGELTDVTLVVDKASFPSHRIVLAAHSEYFYRMFTCGMAETNNKVLPYYSTGCLKKTVHFWEQ